MSTFLFILDVIALFYLVYTYKVDIKWDFGPFLMFRAPIWRLTNHKWVTYMPYRLIVENLSHFFQAYCLSVVYKWSPYGKIK